jgi:hypothetical protein
VTLKLGVTRRSKGKNVLDIVIRRPVGSPSILSRALGLPFFEYKCLMLGLGNTSRVHIVHTVLILNYNALVLRRATTLLEKKVPGR